MPVLNDKISMSKSSVSVYARVDRFTCFLDVIMSPLNGKLTHSVFDGEWRAIVSAATPTQSVVPARWTVPHGYTPRMLQLIVPAATL